MTHSGLQFFLMHWFQKRKANKTAATSVATTNKVLSNQQTNHQHQQQQGSIFTFPNTSRERYRETRPNFYSEFLF